MSYYVPDSWADTLRRSGHSIVTYSEMIAKADKMDMIDRLNKHFKETIWWQ